MGDKKRMDREHQHITLYTQQTDAVVEKLLEKGYHFAKREFIERKYAEVSGVFLDAYAWFTNAAAQLVPRPQEADSPIWAFADARYLESHPGHRILTLRIPIEQAVFFRMGDWSKRLNLRYIGKTEAEELAFAQKLERFGIAYEGDVYTKPFYPHLKKELMDSWANLFRYDAAIKETGRVPHADMQAGLWLIDAQWMEP